MYKPLSKRMDEAYDEDRVEEARAAAGPEKVREAVERVRVSKPLLGDGVFSRRARAAPPPAQWTA
jgi:hypothetical protein